MYVIGIPQEIKQDEYRVSLIPRDVEKLITNCKCRVLVESGAGRASGFEDEEYQKVGAKIVPWRLNKSSLRNTDLIIKVKEPLPPELPMLLLPKKKTIAGFLHFGGNPKLKRFFEENNVPYFDYGEVKDTYGFRPILAAMSIIAGERVVLEGFHYFSKPNGRGIMPRDAVVTIVGAGVAGMAAAEMARRIGVKEINIFDSNLDKIALLSSRFEIQYALAEKITEVLRETDLLISAVAVPGRRAPIIFTREMIVSMPEGSFFGDVAIDEGGSSENSRQPSQEDPLYPLYKEGGVFHYCVPNIPGAFPKTASRILSQAVLPYLITYINKK